MPPSSSQSQQQPDYMFMDNWTFQYHQRGSTGYDAARISSTWNGRVPNRWPRMIVFPESTKDVQKVVEYAKANGLSIGTKSGGHSWTASFLRDGGIMIDLVKMKNFSADLENSTAICQPGAYGSDLNAYLYSHKLIFPAGHCPTVGLGGFLLQGGFGWNSRKWGLACESVLEIELVNAEGEIMRASTTQNPEYFWAARGAGCGYFGVITEFKLKLFPLPAAIMTARYVFALKDFEEIATQLDEASQRFPLDMEVSIFVAQQQDGIEETTAAVTADCLSETKEEAMASLNVVHNLPFIKKALQSYPFITCTLPDMMQRFDVLLDNRGLRYETNNMWTDNPATEIMPGLRNIIDTLPPVPSHLLMVWWTPKLKRPDMTFSPEANLYLALYAIGSDPTKDGAHSDYVVDAMTKMEPWRKGIQLADENLTAHPGKFMKTANYKRLERLREKYDPEGRFHSYIRVPTEFENPSVL